MSRKRFVVFLASVPDEWHARSDFLQGLSVAASHAPRDLGVSAGNKRRTMRASAVLLLDRVENNLEGRRVTARVPRPVSSRNMAIHSYIGNSYRLFQNSILWRRAARPDQWLLLQAPPLPCSMEQVRKDTCGAGSSLGRTQTQYLDSRSHKCHLHASMTFVGPYVSFVGRAGRDDRLKNMPF